MGSLTSCIRKAGKALDKKDADAIKSLRDDLKGDGLDAQAAAIEATVMYMTDLKTERTKLAEAIGDQANYLGQLVNFNKRRSKPSKGVAPEHSNTQGTPKNDKTYPMPDSVTEQRTIKGELPFLDASVFKEIVSEFDWLFGDPQDAVSLDTDAQLGRAKLKDSKYVGPGTGKYVSAAEAKQSIKDLKKHANDQSMTHHPGRGSNADKVVLSLFDTSGEWSQPYRDAGYDVYMFDIQDGMDIMDFSVEYFNANYNFGDVFAILAACPCTDFASSGSRHFAAKDADGRTEASKELVFQTLRTIEFIRPQVWALENPVGRIKKETGLPPWRLAFHPHHFGDDYTKKTTIYGNFNPELETLNRPPVRGSKMFNEYGGGSLATKNARSETPEGFAYSFFKANNAQDMSTEQFLFSKYTNIKPALQAALDAGMTEAEIVEVMDNSWDYDGSEAAQALHDAVADKQNPANDVIPAAVVEEATKGYQNQSAYTFTDADMDSYRAGLRGKPKPEPADPDLAFELSMMYDDAVDHRKEILSDPELQIEGGAEERDRIRAEDDARQDREWDEELKQKRLDDDAALEVAETKRAEDAEWSALVSQEDNFFARERENDIIIKQHMAKNAVYQAKRDADAARRNEERAAYRAERYDGSPLGNARQRIDPWMSHVHNYSLKYRLPFNINKRMDREGVKAFAPKTLKAIGQKVGGSPEDQLARLKAFQTGAQMAVEKAHYGIVLNPMSDEALYDTAVSLHKGRGVDQIMPEDADGNLARILSSVQVGITAEEMKLYGEAEADAATQRQAERIEAEEAAPAPKKSLKTAQAKRKKSYGKQNKVFTESAADKARAAIKAKLGTLNSGIDPELMQAGVTMAGYHIEAGARKFADFATAMIEDLGEGITPYLRSFYESVRYYPGFDAAEMSDAAESDQAYTEIKEAQDAERTTGSEESDSQHRSDEVRGAGSDLSDAGRGRGRRETTRSGQEASGAEQGSGDALDLFGAPVTGERSDNNFHNEKSSLERSAARDTDKKGSSPRSTGGLFAERETNEATEEVLPQAPAVIPAARVSGKINSGDLSQVKTQMPFLTEGQAEDVVFAENRLAKPEGLGVLFTNGTGTGKTFTGLGVVKRMVAQGKKNILIAAPKQTIVAAWIDAARDFFDLTLTPLKDTKDNGTGISITTFANLGDNPSLMSREWDGFVMDESHYLASASDGKSTKALKMLQAMAMTRNTASDRIYAIHSDLVAERDEALARAKYLRTSDSGQAWSEEPAVQARADELTKQLEELTGAERERLEGVKPKDKPRSIFLSATPFAYEKTVRWANEFLFDWGYDKPKDGQKGYGYNTGDHYEDFMMTHFGYRMRYNKLTEPDAKVDRGLMQRAFNTWLKKEGALSGRALDSNFDYDRKFVMTKSALGKQVDDALEWMRGQEGDSDEMIAGKRELDDLLKDSFGYHQRMYFLEAMKAAEAIPHIQAHLDQGRKVVVMHDFKKGGTMNPFILAPSSDEGKMVYGAFQDAFPRLIQAFSYLPSPIETLSKEFPGALVYNGNFSAKKRVVMQNEFNSDAADSPKLIIAQGDAMREGVSIHDTTGKHQRVMVHLGMPVKPTAAIQQEGRIYRTGQASDTMFRYFTIGTNWERYAFASKIAGRASAAENLAMGEQARGLKEAFINAYEEADNYEPGFDGEGQGGKESDKALANSLTPWDMAKSYYFGSKKQGSGRSARGREHSEFFATPEPLGMKMVQWANIRGGETALEPSAGHGAIGRFFPENSTNRAIEFTDELSSKLALHFDGDVQTGDFMDHNVVNKYDGIVMNPPFGQGGKQAADHVRKAMRHLRDGGRIVALIPTGPAADKQFDKLLDSDDAKHIYTAAEIMLPSVTFERAGTSIRTRVLVLEKATDPAQAAKIQQSNRDYTDADSIDNFFDRLENSEIKDRVKPEVEEDEAPQKWSRDTKLPGSESPAELSKPVEGAGFTTMDSKHSKTGKPLYVVNMAGSMGDNYTEYSSIAKNNGGFYIRAKLRSYYKPTDGGKAEGKPTFSFDSAGDRAAFLADVDMNGLGEGSARAAKPKGKVTAAQVEQAIAKLRKGWQAGPDITVVESVEDLPDNITGEMRKQGIAEIAGWWDRKNKHVYLVADGLNSKRDAQVTLLHEAVGHYGIEAIMGKAGINEFLREVHDARETDSKVSEAYDHVNRLYPRASAPQKAAEVVARIAESNPRHNLVQRLFQMIRQALRKMGFNVPFNNNDITEALRRAGANMKTGKYQHGGGKGGLFQAAYHGSPHRHNKFSTDKIGTGEGAQAFGWGLYFAQAKDVAEHYRETLSSGSNPRKILEALGESGNSVEKTVSMSTLFEFAREFDNTNNLDSTVEWARMQARQYDKVDNWPAMADEYRALANAVTGAQRNGFTLSNSDGQLYTVEVPENDELLDWDAPLSEQPEGVQAVFREPGSGGFGRYAGLTGEQAYQKMASEQGGAKEASLLLKSLGVPGLRFWDDQSRQPGDRMAYDGKKVNVNAEKDPQALAAAYQQWYGDDAEGMLKYDNHADAIPQLSTVDMSLVSEVGTRNFVIFDEETIEITDKLFKSTDDGYLSDYMFRVRDKPAPKKTVKAYKLFRLIKSKPGKLFPLFVMANEPIEPNTWLDAESGERNDKGKVKSKIGPLAYRPGWHTGDSPIATHIGLKHSKTDKSPSIRNPEHVWAEVEVGDDVDWQTEANKRAELYKHGPRKGKIKPVTAHITDQVPEDGFYRYKTNHSMEGNWLIAGTMKVNRLLSDEDVKQLNEEYGYSDLERKAPMDLEEWGFNADGSLDDELDQSALLFRAVDESPDSREAMNRRMREEHHGIWHKAKNYAKRQLTPGGLLPRAVFDAKITRDSELSAIEMDVQSHVWALENAFKRDFGKSYDRRTKAQEQLMRDALAGKPSDELPDATLVALESMRQYIDAQSGQYIEILKQDALHMMVDMEPARRQELIQMLQDGVFDGLNKKEAAIVQKMLLLQTMMSNVGEYVNRSYRAFDDKQWVRAVPDEVLNNARDYLESRYLEENAMDTEADAAKAAHRVMESILKEDTAFDSMEAFIKESKLGAKDLSILKRRKQIAPEIRALLGEYNDPRLNFAKTSSKMSRLIFNDTFLKRVREVGMGEFLFEDGEEPEGHWKKIAGDSSEVYAPLNGLKTTPEIHQAFIDALGREQMAGWFKMVVQANGMVKFGKTVLSPTTAARNWMSAMFFALGNGHFDLTQSRKSWQVVKAYFLQHPGSEMDYLRKLKKLGVVYDTPYAGEMMRLLKDTDIADQLLAGKISEGLKARHALNLVQKFYQYGDDFWKIIGFENEIALQMKYRNLPREEAETIAAERIRNAYPTYSMVGRGINQLRRFPLAGTFVSFPAEIVRTSFNMLKYAKEDMQHSPALGARRLAGLAMVSGLAYAAQALSKMLLGVDDDEEEAVREQLPHWSKNSNIYFMSREGGKLRYMDLSFLDPYNYWKRPITAIMRDEPFKDKALSAANDMLSPFFGTDILAGALGEIWMNEKSSGGRVYNAADTGWEQTASMANHLRKAAQPGAFSNAERILKAAKDERTVTGREYSMDDELAALAGFRVSTLDPAISLKYRTYEAQDTLRNASAILSREARDPNPVDEADLRKTFARVQAIRNETYDDLLKSIKAARKSGVSQAAIVRQVQAGGLGKRDAFLLSQGRKPQWRPSVTYMRDAIRSSGDTFGRDMQRQLEQRRRDIVRWSRERS